MKETSKKTGKKKKPKATKGSSFRSSTESRLRSSSWKRATTKQRDKSGSHVSLHGRERGHPREEGTDGQTDTRTHSGGTGDTGEAQGGQEGQR